MAALQELKRQQKVFAGETFAFLLENFKVSGKFLKGYEFFRPHIGDAIVTISYVFRKNYWKIFSRLRENLKHVKMFKNYCLIIPVRKDERYFYNFLTRISLIFELSMYCYYEGFDYFETGLKCVAEYEDLQFFESEGGWGRLGHTALFIASLGQPLILIMSQHYDNQGKEIFSFDGAFNALDSHLIYAGNTDMLDGAEMFCLSQLKGIFQTQTLKADTKCTNKVQRREETESIKCQTSSKPSLADELDPARDLIIEYFKQCFFDLVSSKALGYSDERLGQKNLPSVSFSNIFRERKNLNSLIEYWGLPNPAFDYEFEFLHKKVVYIEQHRNLYPTASSKGSGHSGLNKGKQTTGIELTKEVPVSEMTRGYSDLHNLDTVPGVSERNISIPNQETVSLKFAESVPIYMCCALSSEKDLSVMMSVKSDDKFQKSENDKTEKNLEVQEKLRVQPIFIVPQKYLKLRKSLSCRKSIHLYSVKMCPPSRRKKLDEPMKLLLDEHIENQNYDIMPSGDMLICSRLSSTPKEDTLIILAESSSDDEVEADIDILMCLFKIMEIDSKGNESGYSLRSRQPKPLEKVESKSDLDETGTRKTMVSDKVTTSKFLGTVKRKLSGLNRNEIRRTEPLVKYYKKYFFPLLDFYFKRKFFPLEKVQYRKSEQNTSYCKYVFAVSLSIMAKRKVLLDEPDETKRVLGVQLHEETFRPKILPLDVQRALDSQIRKRNYFLTSNGIYGVGPKHRAAEGTIWAILYSGKGNSKSLELSSEDLREIPKIFRSYEPVLEIFLPLPKETIKSNMELSQSLLENLVNSGFHVNEES